MSTAARKARKRERIESLVKYDELVRRGLPAETLYVHPPFQHPTKTGTPVADRAATVRRADAQLAKASPALIARIANLGAKFASRWAR